MKVELEWSAGYLEEVERAAEADGVSLSAFVADAIRGALMGRDAEGKRVARVAPVRDFSKAHQARRVKK